MSWIRFSACLLLPALALLPACGSEAPALPDAGAGTDASVGTSDASSFTDAGFFTDGDVVSDAGVISDAGMEPDGGERHDAELETDAAGPSDAGPAAGFGTIRGPCDRLAPEVASDAPSYFRTTLDFMEDAFDDPEERPLLTADARTVLQAGTVGGSSEISEAFAAEVLARCEGARLLLTEGEVDYEPPGSKKTDMVVELGGARIGVSVVRAFRFPLDGPLPYDDASRVVEKLEDILESTANVAAEDGWQKQILMVLAHADSAEEVVRAAVADADAAARADTIVFVVVTEGADSPVYE